MKKVVEITTETLIKRNRDLRNQYTSPLVKWYQATMTKREKYMLGMMGYEEFVEWQEELAAEEAAKEAEEAAAKEAEKEKADGEEPVYHTFWENDTGDRNNMSQEDYEAFLAESGINISNKNAIDVNAISEN